MGNARVEFGCHFQIICFWFFLLILFFWTKIRQLSNNIVKIYCIHDAPIVKHKNLIDLIRNKSELYKHLFTWNSIKEINWFDLEDVVKFNRIQIVFPPRKCKQLSMNANWKQQIGGQTRTNWMMEAEI